MANTLFWTILLVLFSKISPVHQAAGIFFPFRDQVVEIF